MIGVLGGAAPEDAGTPVAGSGEDLGLVLGLNGADSQVLSAGAETFVGFNSVDGGAVSGPIDDDGGGDAGSTPGHGRGDVSLDFGDDGGVEDAAGGDSAVPEAEEVAPAAWNRAVKLLIVVFCVEIVASAKSYFSPNWAIWAARLSYFSPSLAI